VSLHRAPEVDTPQASRTSESILARCIAPGSS